MHGLAGHLPEAGPSSPQLQEALGSAPPSTYISVDPPQAHRFNLQDVKSRKHLFNCETSCHVILDHSLCDVVEYPETGDYLGERILHRFQVDPNNFLNPLYNIQYSKGYAKGAAHGGSSMWNSYMIPLANGTFLKNGVKCRKQETSCM